jgi:hypothetical protein
VLFKAREADGSHKAFAHFMGSGALYYRSPFACFASSKRKFEHALIEKTPNSIISRALSSL